MLDTKIRLSRKLTIGPQVSQEELEALAKSGFSTVVNLAGKGECDQLLKPELEGEAVEALGMEYVHYPLSLSKLSMDDIDQLCAQLSQAQTPVYLHCRIGQRASLVGMLFHALCKGITYKTMVKKAGEMGISWRAPFLEKIASEYIERTRPIRAQLLASP